MDSISFGRPVFVMYATSISTRAFSRDEKSLIIFVIPARGRAVACAIRAEKFSAFSEAS